MTLVADPSQLAASSIQHDSLLRSPQEAGYGGGPFESWLLNYWDRDKLPLSPWWCRNRDLELRQYVRSSVLLGGIINSRVLQLKNMSYTLEASDKKAEALLPTYQALLDSSQFGDGFRAFLGKWALDHHTQDNGAFIEWIGPGQRQYYSDKDGNRFWALGPLGNPSLSDSPLMKQAKAKAAIEGFAHIDSGSCWRTYNTEWPVIYRNAYTGDYYILHRTRVSAVAQMAQASELARGIGFCSVSRAFYACELIQSAHTYTYEKITGSSPELGLLKGVSKTAVETALKQNALDMDANGRAFFKGLLLINTDFVAGIDPDIKLIGVKSVPDGWDKEREVDIAMRFVAMAMATTTRELGWSKGETGATKADAESQEDTSEGLGREEPQADIEQLFNTRLLPKGISLQFKPKNAAAEFREAEVRKLRAEARAISITSGEITPQEARELAAREGDLPSEFMDTQTVVEDDSNTPANAISPVDQDPASPVSPDMAEKSTATYDRALRSLVNQYRGGLVDKLTFKREMRNLIEVQFERAWREGARLVQADPNADGAYEELQRLIEEELTYIQQFADAVQEAEKAVTMDSIRQRIGMWANRFIELKNRAMIWLGGDKRLKWVHTVPLNQHDYCRDCIALDGFIMTASEWKRKGVYPQDRRLECGGWECDCELVVTSEAVTRAPFPKMTFGEVN